ncbi:MAG TPA: hypothetical protein VMT32_11390 [Bryobacteraceae bacterium]|nr:hypothetical protein [Bryobacteraceae bacterium]
MLATLLLWLLAGATAQTPPADWKIVKDSKGLCQIAVPPDWEPLSESSGAAVFREATTAIAVATSQPGQAFKPLSDQLQKLLEIRKDRLFENTLRRVFYQDKISRHPEEPNGYSASVPSKGGTCSCHVTVLPDIPGETAKKIALSLQAVEE